MSELRYQDTIPLRWQRLDTELGPAELERLERDNERVLQLLPGLEPAADSADDEGAVPRHVQLLELRLQLLTDLLAELLARTQSLPKPHSMWLASGEAGWRDEAPPAAGDKLLLDVYLNDALPRPVRLQAVVTSVKSANSGAEVEAELLGLSETVTALIEKLIFRQHRRLIARERGRG